MATWNQRTDAGTVPPPSRTERVARELAATHHGAVARRELRAHGCSHDQVRHLFDSPRWRRWTDEVAVLVGAPHTDAQEIAAAVLDAGTGARLSHASAGNWWGLSGCPLRPVQVCRTGSSRRGSTLCRIHEVRTLPEEWTTELRGIPVVRPELLALQLFATSTFGRAERLVERMWSDRLLSGPSLQRLLDSYGSRGRNGSAGLRAYLDARGDAYVPAATGVESRAVQILRGAGLDFRRQVDSGGDRWSGRVDLRHEFLPAILEVQSQRHHRALTDVRDDAARRARLEADGFVVAELWDTTIWTRPDEVIRIAERLLANAGSVLQFRD